MFSFHLVQSANTECLLIKTHRVLSRLSKFADVRYRKNQVLLYFYHWFTIKTKKNQYNILETFSKKNSLRNLARFHSVLFELKILEILTTAFLLKTIVWTWIFFKYCRVLPSLKTKRSPLRKDGSHLKITWNSKRQKKNIQKM